jgi:hypothetical protein
MVEHHLTRPLTSDMIRPLHLFRKCTVVLAVSGWPLHSLSSALDWITCKLSHVEPGIAEPV